MGELIVFQCNCGKQLRAKSKNAGKIFPCPQCYDTVMVPGIVESESTPISIPDHFELPDAVVSGEKKTAPIQEKAKPEFLHSARQIISYVLVSILVLIGLGLLGRDSKTETSKPEATESANINSPPIVPAVRKNENVPTHEVWRFIAES